MPTWCNVKNLKELTSTLSYCSKTTLGRFVAYRPNPPTGLRLKQRIVDIRSESAATLQLMNLLNSSPDNSQIEHL